MTPGTVAPTGQPHPFEDPLQTANNQTCAVSPRDDRRSPAAKTLFTLSKNQRTPTNPTRANPWGPAAVRQITKPIPPHPPVNPSRHASRFPRSSLIPDP